MFISVSMRHRWHLSSDELRMKQYVTTPLCETLRNQENSNKRQKQNNVANSHRMGATPNLSLLRLDDTFESVHVGVRPGKEKQQDPPDQQPKEQRLTKDKPLELEDSRQLVGYVQCRVDRAHHTREISHDKLYQYVTEARPLSGEVSFFKQKKVPGERMDLREQMGRWNHLHIDDILVNLNYRNNKENKVGTWMLYKWAVEYSTTIDWVIMTKENYDIFIEREEKNSPNDLSNPQDLDCQISKEAQEKAGIKGHEIYWAVAPRISLHVEKNNMNKQHLVEMYNKLGFTLCADAQADKYGSENPTMCDIGQIWEMRASALIMFDKLHLFYKDKYLLHGRTSPELLPKYKMMRQLFTPMQLVQSYTRVHYKTGRPLTYTSPEELVSTLPDLQSTHIAARLIQLLFSEYGDAFGTFIRDQWTVSNKSR